MTPDEHQQVVEEFQDVIDDTQHTIDRLEATGMDEKIPENYGKLLDILDDAVTQQREHTLAMLGQAPRQIAMNQIGARELMREVLPQLQATRNLIDTILNERIKTCYDEDERRRLTILQDEFTLEMTMIRMNLEHLLKRYSDQLEAASREEQHFKSLILTMDGAQATAIERVKSLYARAYQLQTGWL